MSLFCRLTLLQQIDDDKVANEQAKNSLESHIFETKDAMYSERVLNVSTEEQREVITTALNEAANWMEDDGYFASTKASHSISTDESNLNSVVPQCTRYTFQYSLSILV